MAISNIFYNISKSNFMNNHANKVINDDIYGARLLVCSNVLKDAIVYGFRYDKSRKNEEIPKEKRGFVAALDLASGFTTSIIQLAIGFAISNRKFQTNICNKLFGHLKDKTPELFEITKKGFIAASALVGSGVIGERILVPLLATPMATIIKNKHSSGESTKKEPTFGTHPAKHKEVFSAFHKA